MRTTRILDDTLLARAMRLTGLTEKTAVVHAGLEDGLVAEHEEVRSLVERRGLAGKGIGWLDAHLMAAARIAGIRLWTFDRALAEGWRAIGG